MLFTDEAVIGPARRNGLGDDALRRLVGFGDRVETGSGFVGHVQGLPEIWADHLPGGVGKTMGECDEVGIRQAVLICHSITSAGPKT